MPLWRLRIGNFNGLLALPPREIPQRPAPPERPTARCRAAGGRCGTDISGWRGVGPLGLLEGGGGKCLHRVTALDMVTNVDPIRPLFKAESEGPFDPVSIRGVSWS